jgi:hypothetical protein
MIKGKPKQNKENHNKTNQRPKWPNQCQSPKKKETNRSKGGHLSDKMRKSKSKQEKRYKYDKVSLRNIMWGKNQRKNKMSPKSVGVIHKYAIMTPFIMESDLKSLLYAWIPTCHLMSRNATQVTMSISIVTVQAFTRIFLVK